MGVFHDHLPLAKHYMSRTLHPPRVLSVGVGDGTMFIPLSAYMARSHVKFMLMGIDALVTEHIKLVLQNLDFTEAQMTVIVEGDAHDVLPDIIDQKLTYDIIFFDSDLDAFASTLNELPVITHKGSIVLVNNFCEPSKQQIINAWFLSHPEWRVSHPLEDANVGMLTHRL